MTPAKYDFTFSQGVSFDATFAITVNGSPADLTNAQFLATLKPDINMLDTDPEVVMINWTGTGSNGNPDPTLGFTTMSIQPSGTQSMTTVRPYNLLIRAENIPLLPEVFDFVTGTVKVSQPVSSRF